MLLLLVFFGALTSQGVPLPGRQPTTLVAEVDVTFQAFENLADRRDRDSGRRPTARRTLSALAVTRLPTRHGVRRTSSHVVLRSPRPNSFTIGAGTPLVEGAERQPDNRGDTVMQ